MSKHTVFPEMAICLICGVPVAANGLTVCFFLLFSGLFLHHFCFSDFFFLFTDVLSDTLAYQDAIFVHHSLLIEHALPFLQSQSDLHLAGDPGLVAGRTNPPQSGTVCHPALIQTECCLLELRSVSRLAVAHTLQIPERAHICQDISKLR